VTLNIGCAATYAGCYIEKGMGLIIPGFTPSTLGEIYVYTPTMTEVRIAAGVFALGFLLFTMLLRVAVAILLGELRLAQSTADGMPEAGARPDYAVAPPPYPVDAR